MSFICGLCAIYTKPGDKATHVVVETRRKVYPLREGVYVFVSKDQPRRRMVTDDPGGVGTEIVKEVLACQTCAKAQEEKVA